MGRGMIVVLAFAFALAPVAALRAVPPRHAQGTPAPGTRQVAEIPGVETFSDLSHGHAAGPVDYPQVPPAGGPHAPVWQDCGFYDRPVRSEHAVHSLEHGAVWITYRPDLPAEQVRDLRRLARQNDYVLISPYPGLPAPVVASAWGKRLRLEESGDPRLRLFVETYAGKGPEPGAPCEGGTAETVPSPEGTPAATPAATPSG